nr:immunoglobulin heavy chain junction region [Macaca mulatta]
CVQDSHGCGFGYW